VVAAVFALLSLLVVVADDRENMWLDVQGQNRPKKIISVKNLLQMQQTENGIRANLILTMAFQRSRFLRMAEMQFSKT
jgi:hypothetical protein